MNKLYLLLFFLCIKPVYALTQQDSLPRNTPALWTLQACIAYAKENNISIATLRLTQKSTEEDLLQARAAVMPNLTGQATQSLVNGNSSLNAGAGVQTSGNYGLNSAITLYNGGLIKNDIKYRQLAVLSANLSIKETENDISLSITQTFFNILLAKENITAIQSVLTTSLEQLNQGQIKYDLGSIARKDLLILQSQVAADQYSLVNANSNYQLNLVILKQLLLLPTAYTFLLSIPETIPINSNSTILLDAQKEAQKLRPEIQNGELQVQLTQVALDKIRANSKPLLSAGASLSTGYSGNQGYGYVTGLNNNFYQSLGLTLGIPIYNRRVNLTNTNKTKILLAQSKLSLINVKTILNQQVEQSYINLLNAQAQYVAANTQLQANREIYRITNEQLQLGAVTTLEMLLQRNSYIQSLQAFLQAKYAKALYNKIYEFYMGIPISF
jgi:outer membrane protein